MSHPELKLVDILETAGVDFTASLPCEKIKALLEIVAERFFHVPLTREEEGVGICAGAALAGRRPAVFVQSSGVGNMINALLSLTRFYELPLALFVSRRGVYQEKIAAQVPMGERLPALLRGAGIPVTEIAGAADLAGVGRKLNDLYRRGTVHAFLLSPAVWEGSSCRSRGQAGTLRGGAFSEPAQRPVRAGTPKYRRYEILKAAAPLLKGKVVVCNLGIPSKELFAIADQPSNFYMLGSMGMALPIGLGISLSSRREVVVIDGDGSLLMNPGTLATAGCRAPRNLTVLAIDNGAYGSTGNQPTLSSGCVDLEAVARGFGFVETYRVSGTKKLAEILRSPSRSARFIHLPAVAGNADVPNIPLHHIENRKRLQEFLKA